MTHKQVLKAAAEGDELLWATWQAMYGDIPANILSGWMNPVLTIRPARETMDGQTLDVLASTEQHLSRGSGILYFLPLPLMVSLHLISSKAQ